jgi:hypothetical protein
MVLYMLYSTLKSMGLITIKTPNPKCFYWCLIEFTDCKYSQLCWYFRPDLFTIACLTFSLVSYPPPPLSCVNKYTVYVQYKRILYSV